MSQKSAVWNLALNFFPAIGLLFMLVPLARIVPQRFFAVTAALSVIGFCLLAAAKWSLIRDSRYVSFGSRDMSVWNRRLYRTAYVLMGGGVVGAILFAIAWS
jgi:hypothetical protein